MKYLLSLYKTDYRNIIVKIDKQYDIKDVVSKEEIQICLDYDLMFSWSQTEIQFIVILIQLENNCKEVIR